MPNLISRLAALLSLLVLAACAGGPKAAEPPPAVPGYESVEDGGFVIQAVDARYLSGNMPRQEVDFTGDDKPGTIVVDPHFRKLYWVMEGGRAMRYSIAVGRSGLGFRGSAVVARKAEWPNWQPTANMIRTFPEFYAEYAGGLPGGLENPLGARALYLYRGKRDTYFRIHGTVDVRSIGRATSAGCIRLFNQDIIDLYNRVPNGTRVRVRSLEESERLEGKWMEDEYGLLIPYDESRIEEIKQKKAELEAQKAAEEAAAAEQTVTAGTDAAAQQG